MTDPISDMFIRIKNALAVKKKMVEVPYSKLKSEIAELLKKQGYLSTVERRGKKVRRCLELGLVYDAEGYGRITDIKRISKLSRRVYKSADQIGRVKQGVGISVISTSKGLKTGAQAKKERLGGEIICEIW
jgi:small subunit ribosomal protein S8